MVEIMAKDIKKLIAHGEDQNLEFKASLRLREEIGETISAFANVDGGIILVGVSDKSEILGVDIGKKTIEDLANWVKENTDPHISGAFVVVFKLPPTIEDLQKLGLNERQIKAVVYVKEKGKITNKEYREMTDLSDEGARIDLNMLVEVGIFRLKGSGRGAHYVLK